MKKTAIVTDTAGISVKEAKQLGVHVIPMPFHVDGKDYIEGENLTAMEFYEMLEKDADISTSQPSAGEVMDFWDHLLEEYDEILHLPMSSGLSGTYANAKIFSQDYGNRVTVVDTGRVSVPQRAAICDAITLLKKGYSAHEICGILEREQENSSVYIMVETLKYLKKGGRITPAAAALGTVLKIRPILQIHGKTLDAYAKVRSQAKGKNVIIKAMKAEMERMGVSKPSEVRIQAACSYGFEGKDQWVSDLKNAFPGFEVEQDYLPLNITCHVGPGAIGGAVTKKINC